MVSSDEKLEAEARLIVQGTEKSLEVEGRKIISAAAAKATLLGGGTERVLVRDLAEQLQNAADLLIAAHVRTGTFDAKEISKRVSSKLKPISTSVFDSRAKLGAGVFQ